jgi:hypothetical protein
MALIGSAFNPDIKGWTSSSKYACISVTKYSCGLFSTLDYSSIIHFRRRFAYSARPACLSCASTGARSAD